MGSFRLFRKKVPLTEEQLKWNKMWQLWASGKAASPYAELMTYQSEVNNGGHDQYFSNIENTGNIPKELCALYQILPTQLNANLQKAYEAYFTLAENEEDEHSEAILEQCDDMFYEQEEEINCALKAYASGIEL